MLCIPLAVNSFETPSHRNIRSATFLRNEKVVLQNKIKNRILYVIKLPNREELILREVEALPKLSSRSVTCPIFLKYKISIYDNNPANIVIKPFLQC